MEEEFDCENNVEDTDNDIYSEKARDQLLEDDELTAGEEGFMLGYIEA